jgi:hypothetical protein
MMARTPNYAIHGTRCFDNVGQFVSYARLMRLALESAGTRIEC